jgi:RNA polymerase sigma factor (sigma-70 family)
MANAELRTVVRYIRDVAGTPESKDQNDGELLRAFRAHGDQAAFEGIVKQHGPLVMAVCRRTLGHVQDAEDAFQATFLILARRAASIRKEESLAAWLHGVACRVSKSARRSVVRRRKHEGQAQASHPGQPESAVAWQEVQRLVDEETQRLPFIYREAFVLCCLENRCCAEVARYLRQNEGTVRSRVARARQRLQKRLSKRGVSLSATLSAAAAADNVSAVSISASLVHSTVQAGFAYAAGRTVGVLSSEVVTLVRGVTKAMFYAKLKIVFAVLLTVSAAATGFGILGHQVLAGPDDRSGSQSNTPIEAAPTPAGTDTKSRFLAFDAFDGKFMLNWSPVRPDPSHVSLTKFPGQLTITTQQGTIHADANAQGEPFARNLWLMNNPLGPAASFVLTTSVSDFTPTVAYQQAGLICYDDDDNYVKWAYEYDWEARQGQRVILVRESDAKAIHDPGESVSGWKRVWLRLTKRGDRYEYAASRDAKTFKVYGEKSWGKGAPKKVGILAKSGGPSGVPEIDARFDFFEMRSPAPRREE